jgi:hypothetical protein
MCRHKEFIGLLALTLAAVAVHGYHPGVEDAEIYLPAVLKRLQPALFRFDAQFFESHASMSAFAPVVATSVRITHLPVGVVTLMWHVTSIFGLLFACWRIGRACFPSRVAAWSGVALVAALLTIPVAGTSLYLMDQYLTARSFSTPGTLLAVACAAEGNAPGTVGWLALTAPIHPLMTGFAASYLAILVLSRRYDAGSIASAWFLPFDLLRPPSPAYQKVLETRPLHLITHWMWYHWLGVVAPVALLAWFARIGRERRFGPMSWLCRGLILFVVMFSAIALVIAVPGRFEQMSELQPMRSLHLVYILLFVFVGGLIGEVILRQSPWRWALLFVPLCTGMWFAQRQQFPATAHLEWPWAPSPNRWVQAFDWIREHTPTDSYFALDPNHMARPEEDQHGFRAIAWRSMLADRVKDSGAASMFPALANDWLEQVQAAADWPRFTLADFEQLRRRYGVDWIVLERPGISGLVCPYQNDLLLVCWNQ